MKKYIQSYAYLVVIAGLIIILDQWTKALVRTNIPFGGYWSPWPWLAPYARIVNWDNTGAAFGMFQGFNGVLSILAIIVAVFIFYYYPKLSENDWPMRIAMGLMLGGALGNFVDRIMMGRVTDFISVGSFAVFNVADSSITIGVILLILIVWYRDRQEKKRETSQQAVPVEENNHNERIIQDQGDQIE